MQQLLRRRYFHDGENKLKHPWRPHQATRPESQSPNSDYATVTDCWMRVRNLKI